MLLHVCTHAQYTTSQLVNMLRQLGQTAAGLAIGAEDLQTNMDNFQNSEDPDYQLIPVFAARRLGILPIAFQSDCEFVAVPKK